MEKNLEIILISDSESDIKIENADDTNNIDIENTNNPILDFVEREKLPTDIIHENCKKLIEPPQYEEEAEVDEDTVNTFERDMNNSGDKDNIICNGRDTDIKNGSDDNSSDIDVIEPPIAEPILISSDEEESLTPDAKIYINPRLLKTFPFKYSRRTSSPGPESRTRNKLSNREKYQQILDAGFNPRNGVKLFRFTHRIPDATPPTYNNMASTSGVNSNLTRNIESDDCKIPNHSMQSIFLGTDHCTASTSSNSATVEYSSVNTNVSRFDPSNPSYSTSDIVVIDPPIAEPILISSNEKESPIPDAEIYIHPMLLKTFPFKYSRITSRPGPKSRTRKKLSNGEMYQQIWDAGFNPRNGVKLYRFTQRIPDDTPPTYNNMASTSGVNSNLTRNIESDDCKIPNHSMRSIFLGTDHCTDSTSSNSAIVEY